MDSDGDDMRGSRQRKRPSGNGNGSAALSLAGAEATLAEALEDHDLVLAGELLLGWPTAHWTPVAAIAFGVLVSAEAEGSLPDPLPEIVAAVCGAALQHYRELPAAEPLAVAEAESLLTRLGAGAQPRWMRVLRDVTPERRGSCLSFLRDIAVLRARRRLAAAVTRHLRESCLTGLESPVGGSLQTAVLYGFIEPPEDRAVS